MESGSFVPESGRAHYAVHCQHLSRALDYGRGEEYTSICLHPARDGKECVGPFLEDLETGCGLWERVAQAYLIPLPQPERWQHRQRREGYDLQRAPRTDWR
jgi:hypothetical protein